MTKNELSGNSGELKKNTDKVTYIQLHQKMGNSDFFLTYDASEREDVIVFDCIVTKTKMFVPIKAMRYMLKELDNE